jgi:hypothetical protein
MSEELKYSVFCVDFRDFKSAKELDNFFKQVGLDMNGDTWYELYLGNWIKGVRINKVWFDLVTSNLIAYETCQEQMMYPSFADYLTNLKPIDLTFKYGKIEFPEGELTIDGILDKILRSGPESISQRERDFLNKNSENI